MAIGTKRALSHRSTDRLHGSEHHCLSDADTSIGSCTTNTNDVKLAEHAMLIIYLAHEFQALSTDVTVHARVSIDLLANCSKQAIAVSFLSSQLPTLFSKLGLPVRRKCRVRFKKLIRRGGRGLAFTLLWQAGKLSQRGSTLLPPNAISTVQHIRVLY